MNHLRSTVIRVWSAREAFVFQVSAFECYLGRMIRQDRWTRDAHIDEFTRAYYDENYNSFA